MDIFTCHINKFDEDSNRKLGFYLSLCKQYNQKTLPIIIDSYGGEAYSLLGMLSMIEESGIDIITICFAKAMSCGAVLFAAGKERYLGKHATVLIHEPSNIAFGTASDIKSESEETQRIKNKSFEILDKACNKESGFFLGLLKENNNSDLFLTPEQCLEYGLATQIKVPSLADILPNTQDLKVEVSNDNEFDNIKILMNYDYKNNPNFQNPEVTKQPIINKKEVSKSMTEEEIKELQERNKKLELELSKQKQSSLDLITKIEKDKDSSFVENLIMNKKILPNKKESIISMLNKAIDSGNIDLRNDIKNFFSNESVSDIVSSVPKMADSPEDTKQSGDIEKQLKQFAEKKGLSMDNPLEVYNLYIKEGGKI